MGLQKQVIEQMKVAMKAKDTVALTALRALKSAFMIANTQTGTATEISEEEALKIIQKQVKQRKDSAAVFTEQKRDDLAKPELEEATVLEQFLPEALSEEEIAKVVAEVIAKTKATGMKDMGKVMGMASKELAGKADGATISAIVKKTLA
ncbi:GatB/YqeY domain-containing protein [Tenacibaculum finnmarkense]|uniref:Glutamyl-tRNA amidotransferase n=1 Tax=Tenacibaculum finnmarkense genomovar ulcerans TaxID=2781388 RepID=A0A2I2M9V0_9FLAO|nr:GatB/YqeY domain-containing protein [Tenacibaculum finnmarkense]MBE7648194.1 GatB/YqeY domain-containing protein [Tenacibaculum finnmarkense genomovar ulcerans]MBE7688933.1 GatB/YqeY domain-containing protein [Tenacibaculum finnmarkense genomovar ulcerans]MBE7697941.1 GatB/YqeY domain-containing protein [Tenacibaculum finnmarkense genomovar ulcerans]MCD8433352.1 GatB/YqeY domain-containing protein [Tenacibaculum finnmarkense genomovar ulcerans]MCD8443684.1 GatB/YqeY domain-containing protei